MRPIVIFLVSFIVFGCTQNPKRDQILGEWEIISWIDANNETDLMKADLAPKYLVHFKPDSVHVTEKESDKTHNYRFKWKLSADTLRIESLGDFRIDESSRNTLALSINGTKIFSKNKESFKNEIKLMRTVKQ